MNRFASRFARFVAPVALALAFAATLTSCGSGAVSGPAPVDDPTRITVLPETATAYSGLPTTLVISGGTGSYIVSSNNQAVIPVAGSITGGSLTFIPNPVTTNTDVTITVRDTGTTPVVNATVTVRPGTVANDITVTPSSTQGFSCDPAICSGGDALVTATLSQGGIPLPARGVRFEVVSGDFRFITSPPDATSETLDTQVTVITDETGKARARLRVTAAAANQTAILQVTDLGTGAFQRTSFIIAQVTGTSPGFFATPDKIVFQGVRTDQCASNGTAAVFVFGGTPPYVISSTTSAFSTSVAVVANSGDGFSIRPNGTCVADPGAPIIIRDAAGRTVTVLVSNIPGTQTPPPLAVGPTTLTLSSCSSKATFTAVGGTGNYIPNYDSGSLLVTTPFSGGTFTVQRAPNSAATTSPQNVAVTDGTSSASVTVNLTGNALGACPTKLTPSTSAVTLTSCAVQTVAVSGGSGVYAVSSSNANITATLATGGKSPVSIQQTIGSGTFAGSATVTVTDTTDPTVSTTIQVTDTAPGPC